jgi:dihydrofolate reductase
VSQAGAFLYGRRMYETMASYWPTADKDLSNPEYILEFAHIWQQMPMVVFSQSLERVEGNARLVRGDLAQEVTRLKEQPGKDLLLGGANLASTLLPLGLIDEYQIYIHPVVLGGGTPMFPAMDDRIALRLVETRRFGSEVVFLRYQDQNSAS